MTPEERADVAFGTVLYHYHRTNRTNYGPAHPQDKCDAIQDCISDILHLLGDYGMDVDDTLRVAKDNYEAELRGEM